MFIANTISVTCPRIGTLEVRLSAASDAFPPPAPAVLGRETVGHRLGTLRRAVLGFHAFKVGSIGYVAVCSP